MKSRSKQPRVNGRFASKKAPVGLDRKGLADLNRLLDATKGVPEQAVFNEAVLNYPAWKAELEAAPATSGIKLDTGKVRTDLLSFDAILELAKVLTFGANKYAAHNWRKGLEWSRVIAALLRHTFAFASGQDMDPETGLSHMAHAMCCAMFLLEYQLLKTGTDDRFHTKQQPKPL